MKAIPILVIFTCLVLAGCSSDEQSKVDIDNDEIAAVVDEWTYTRDDLQTLIDDMPELDKQKYSTPGGRAELTDEVIQEELYYREGLKLGMQEDERLREAVTRYERGLIIGMYFDKHIKPLAFPTEEEMYDYYEDNIQRFTRQQIARAQHILSVNNPDKLREYKRLVESGEEKFSTLAHKYSEDSFTRDAGGDLGFFNPGGYMRGVGYADELSGAAFDLQVGQISEPIKWKKGWSIIVLNEMRPAVVKPFEEVREEIKDVFWVQRKVKVRKVAYGEMRKNYHVENIFANEFALISRTPEELWNLAQNSSDSYERLRYYQEIVESHPTSEHAAKAMFMVGFVYAEELNDYRSADRAFTRVLNEYPDSEVAESAKYMLETMNKPGPALDAPEAENEDTSG